MFALCGILVMPGAMASVPEQSEPKITGEWLDASLRIERGDRTLTPPPPEPKPETAIPEPPRDWFGGAPWRQWSNMTGDWGGARTRLKDLGFDIGGDYTMDWSVALKGGLSQRGVARGLLTQHLSFDPKPLLGIEGGQLFAQYIYRHGRNGSDDIGDIQGYSNIDADRLSKAEEFWYEQRLLADRIRIKAGQVDANSEFAFVEAASEFLNSSAGYSPTILDMPTYPQPRLSLNLFAYATTNFYVGGGVYGASVEDGADFENPFGIFETGLTKPASDRLGAGRVAIGGWHSARAYDCFHGGSQEGASGFYAVAEQQVWREDPKDAENKQGLALFAQYGFGDKDVSDVAHHISAGLRYAGLIPGRDDDSAGLMCSYARLSRANGSPHAHDENALEWYYRVQVTGCLSLQPDLQWISNPGGAPGDALVGTLRMKIDF